MSDTLEARLRRRRQDGLYRTRMTLHSPQSVRARADDGREYLSFCSNDYLGLANHPFVIDALRDGAERWGAGSGASHLISGHMAPHQALEEELADFIGAQRVVLFSTGYMANLALAQVLTGRRDLLLEDRLNHASLLDAGLLSRADMRRYPHADVAAVARLLQDHAARQTLIMSDAVFSMDGDLAPVPQLLQLAKTHAARLVLDDAHGFGVLGADGRGSVQHHGISLRSPLIIMATLGKALGTFGAFVAADETIAESLIQFARTYIYTTAPPPAVAEATRAALRLVQDEPWRRARLRELVQRFRAGATQLGLPLLDSSTPIQPIVLRAADAAMDAAAALREHGILLTAIRPPTVPAGSARLRVTLCAEHSDTHIDMLLSALDTVVPQSVRQEKATVS